MNVKRDIVGRTVHVSQTVIFEYMHDMSSAYTLRSYWLKTYGLLCR